MQQGIAIEKAKEIVKLIKDSKAKAQATIQADTGAGQQQGSRYITGYDCNVEEARLWHRPAVHELSLQLADEARSCILIGKGFDASGQKQGTEVERI